MILSRKSTNNIDTVFYSSITESVVGFSKAFKLHNERHVMWSNKMCLRMINILFSLIIAHDYTDGLILHDWLFESHSFYQIANNRRWSAVVWHVRLGPTIECNFSLSLKNMARQSGSWMEKIVPKQSDQISSDWTIDCVPSDSIKPASLRLLIKGSEGPQSAVRLDEICSEYFPQNCPTVDRTVGPNSRDNLTVAMENYLKSSDQSLKPASQCPTDRRICGSGDEICSDYFPLIVRPSDQISHWQTKITSDRRTKVWHGRLPPINSDYYPPPPPPPTQVLPLHDFSSDFLSDPPIIRAMGRRL